MKILHVFDFFSPHGGGTVDLVYKITRSLAQRGHEVTIYTSDFKLDRDYIASLPEVKVYPFHCVSNLGLFYITPSLVRAAREHLEDFDIIQLNCFRSFQNIVIHHYAKKYKVPYVLDTRGSLPRKAAGEAGFKWVLRWLFDVLFGYRILKDAVKVVAESEYGYREYRELGLEHERIAVIPYSFPTEDFAHLPSPGQFRKKYGIGDKRVVMSLSRLHSIKGIDFLVESFYDLARSRRDVVLCIVGNDDGYLGKLKRLVHKLNLEERVLFTGFLGGKDKLAALVDADVFVQPSRYEYTAWTPMEAILCGTPIVVSKGSGASIDVDRMDAGYMVEYDDKSQMVQTIQAILDNPSEARGKVRRAKEYIHSNLQLDKMVDNYERLYQRASG